MLRSLRLGLLLWAGAALAAPAQETASDTLLTVDHYLDWEQVADPQISPDGAQIVYTRRWVNKVDDKWDSALWIMSVDGSHHRFLVKGSDARWSPDGRRILYLADGEPKGTQIFVRWMDAEGASSQITRVAEKPSDAKWSPDGKAISFVMVVPDSTACRTPPGTGSTRYRASTRWTSRVGRSVRSSRGRDSGSPRRCRPTGAPLRSPAPTLRSRRIARRTCGRSGSTGQACGTSPASWTAIPTTCAGPRTARECISRRPTGARSTSATPICRAVCAT